MTTNQFRKGFVFPTLALGFALSFAGAGAICEQMQSGAEAKEPLAKDHKSSSEESSRDSSEKQLIATTPPVLEAMWNKSPDDYEYGDRFTITLTAKQRCYAYLFYITDNDESLALFPARNQGNNFLQANLPMAIENVESNMMQVDTTPGRLVLLSITDSKEGSDIRQQLLKANDWEAARKPTNHWLTISGKQLVKKLETLKAAYPNSVGYTVEEAPRARVKPQPLRFGKPMRYEITWSEI